MQCDLYRIDHIFWLQVRMLLLENMRNDLNHRILYLNSYEKVINGRLGQILTATCGLLLSHHLTKMLC